MRFFKAFLAHACTAGITFVAVVLFLQSGKAWLNVENIRVSGSQGTRGLEINHAGLRVDGASSSILLSNYEDFMGTRVGPNIMFISREGVTRTLCTNPTDQRIADAEMEKRNHAKAGQAMVHGL